MNGCDGAWVCGGHQALKALEKISEEATDSDFRFPTPTRLSIPSTSAVKR